MIQGFSSGLRSLTASPAPLAFQAAEPLPPPPDADEAVTGIERPALQEAVARVAAASLAPAPLTPEAREMRVRTAEDPKPIAWRLRNDIARALIQMGTASAKGFQYREGGPAPRGLSTQTMEVGGFRVGIAQAFGHRWSMEDTHCALNCSVTIGGIEEPLQIFGVFDGHGGDSVANYVRENIAAVLQDLLREHNPDAITDLGIYNALKLLGVCLQANFERDVRGFTGMEGTCLTAAIILRGRLYTLNIGDSRIILVGPTGETSQLTADQKPPDPYFEGAIQRRGGYVSFDGRVNGNLATAKAIGDLDLGLAVSARGKVSDHGPLVSGSRIVVACDGIWDVASSTEFGAALHAHRETDLTALSYNLVSSCVNSLDNLTLMIVVVP